MSHVFYAPAAGPTPVTARAPADQEWVEVGVTVGSAGDFEQPPAIARHTVRTSARFVRLFTI
jgi:hypothetical protein